MYSNGDLEFIAGFGYTKDEKKLAREFLVERTEQEKNPGVWTDAPEWATEASVEYRAVTPMGAVRTWRMDLPHRRTLPKTKAREIAEKAGREFPSNDGFITMDRKTLAEVVLNAINEALGGEK